jgi:hypothetical protein
MHDMWLGAMGRIAGRVVYLREPYLRYRRHGGNVSPSQRQSWPRMIGWRLSLAFALARRMLAVRLGLHAGPVTAPGSDSPAS